MVDSACKWGDGSIPSRQNTLQQLFSKLMGFEHFLSLFGDANVWFSLLGSSQPNQCPEHPLGSSLASEETLDASKTVAIGELLQHWPSNCP